MKRKLFLAIIAVLVVCLMCGMLFVACNDDPPADDGGNGGVTPPPVDPTDPTDPKGDAYDALIDAFDAVAQDESKEFTFALQITEKNDDGSSGKEIFGIAMEQLGTGADRADYLYAAVKGEGYVKFNGFDLGHLVMTLVDDWFGLLGERIAGMVPITAEGFKGGVVKPVMVGQLLGDYAVSESGDAFMFELTLGGIVSLVDKALAEKGGLDGILGGAIGTDTVTTVVDTLAGLMKIELTENTLSALLNEIASNYRVNFYFGFDGATADDADPFDGLLPGVKDARGTDAKNVLNVTLDGTAELKDAEGNVTGRYDIDVDIDLNPFALFGIFDMVSGNVECLLSGVEINPAWKLAFNGTPEEIVALVEQLGYINVTVDEVNLEDNSFKKNILTIYSDFAEGNAIVQLNGEMIIIIPVAIGGVFDFDALADFIADAIGGTVAQTEEGTEEGGEETGLDIMALLGDIFGLTNFNVFAEDFDFEAAAADVAANGLTLRMSGLMDVIDQITDVDADVALGMSLRDLLPSLWKNAETMTIKIESAGFGNAVRVDQADLSAVKNDSTPSNGLVSEVTDIDIQKVVYGSINMGLDYKYTLTGTDFNGEEVEFEGYILGYANGTSLNFTQAGEQTVTLYVAAGNAGESLIGMLTDMIDLTGYPVFGIYTIDVTFDVLGAESVLDDTAIIGANGEASETFNFSYSDLSSSSMQTPFELLRKYTSGVGYTVGFQITYEGANYVFYMDQTAFNANYKILNDDGTDITATAVNESGDIVLPAGNYKLQLTYEGWTAEANLAVSTIGIAAAVADQGAPVLGEQYNYGIVITETMPDGTTETLAATNLSYRIGSTTIANMHTDEVDFDAVGTSDSSNKFLVTLDKLTNSFGAHYVTVAATSTLTESSVSSMRFDFGTVATPDSGLTATTKGTGAFGESLDNIFTITVSGQKYTLHWNGTDWDAVYADGDSAGQVNDAIDVTFELNWRADEEDEFAGGPVTLSAQGYITNNPVTNGASNMQNIDWKVTVGDMSTTGSFTISPAYINNSEVTVGTNLSGDTGRTLNTYALADTDNNPETASVRTQVYMVWEDGAYVAKARVYNSSDRTYTFYDVETVSVSLKVIAIDGDSENDVTASIFDANGGFNAAGTYRVEFTLTTGDADYNFTTTYTVNAAQA